ncbi:MAG: MFS transporter, partial [Burkholderiales bacterium]|nr:MFS transporter [Anaerolineae bacterium]
LGAVLLTLGRHPVFTIGATLVMGYIGSLLLVMIQAALADLHGNRRGIAITESNTLAVGCAGLAPLLVGGLEGAGLSWRIALYVAALLWALSAVWLWRDPLPESAQPVSTTAAEPSQQRFPLVYWAYCLVVFLCVSVEWGVISNGADFLNIEIGFTKSEAATLMTAFFAAMLVGRAAGSYLSRRMSTPRLLISAIGITLVGFPLFWLTDNGILNIIGLFLVGLGVANLFPLTLSAAVSVVPWNSNVASARVSMSSGSALLVTPLLVGYVADNAGLFNAYAIVGVLLLLAAIVTVYANRTRTASDVQP